MKSLSFFFILIAILSTRAKSQFNFNQYQNNPFLSSNPQRQQIGHQQFAFPQTDFVFPGHLPQQRPAYSNNFEQARPQSNHNDERPKPTFAPKFTRTPAQTSPIPRQSGTLQVNRIDERISQSSKKKAIICYYLNNIVFFKSAYNILNW